MVNLEHIKLLESRISKAIDYVKKVNDENKLLTERLGSYQTRIEELEVLVQQFREEQSRIEDGILSALDRLNQFEDALENKLSTPEKKEPASKPAPKTAKQPAPPQAAGKSDAPLSEAAAPEPLPEEEADEAPEDNGELDIF